VGGVHQVVVELDHLLETGPDGLEGRLEVVEHLPRLGADVVWPDDRTRTVQGDLPGDVDRPTRRHLHHVGAVRRRVHCLGVDEVRDDWDLRGGGIGQATLPVCCI
jgi:hypothetical protein